MRNKKRFKIQIRCEGFDIIIRDEDGNDIKEFEK